MTTPFEGWAILELLGHRTRPGFVSEVEMAGTKMLRVDIPISTDDAGQDVVLTEYYGGASVYALRPCTEAVARANLKWMSDPRPVRPMDFREPSLPRAISRALAAEPDEGSHLADDEDDMPF